MSEKRVGDEVLVWSQDPWVSQFNGMRGILLRFEWDAERGSSYDVRLTDGPYPRTLERLRIEDVHDVDVLLRRQAAKKAE